MRLLSILFRVEGLLKTPLKSTSKDHFYLMIQKRNVQPK